MTWGTDSSAAKAIGTRQRPGKASPHGAEVQDVVQDGWVKLKTVRSTENVADHLTKPKSKVEIEELLKKVGAEFEE